MTATNVIIAHLLPHAGNMVLIDRIDAWDAHGIQCSSDSHRKADHPLRSQGRLSALHMIEYGAQAMGVHGGLLHGSARQGFLAAVRDVRFYVETLDTVAGSLHIYATALGKSGRGVIYQLRVSDAQCRLLMEGRATIIHS